MPWPARPAGPGLQAGTGEGWKLGRVSLYIAKRDNFRAAVDVGCADRFWVCARTDAQSVDAPITTSNTGPAPRYSGFITIRCPC